MADCFGKCIGDKSAILVQLLPSDLLIHPNEGHLTPDFRSLKTTQKDLKKATPKNLGVIFISVSRWWQLKYF